MGKKKAIIGVDSVHYALLISDTSSGASWQAAVALPGVTELGVNPNGAVATLFADNGPAVTANSIGEIEVSLNMADLTPEERAILLGHERSGGVTKFKSSDISPEVALGFRTKLSDGTYGYVWLMKGKFAETEETIETQGDSVNFQVAALTGKFTILEYNEEWKRTTRTDDPDYVSSLGENW
ncbi:major tail protein, partial [Desulfoscipio geothermicus]